MMSYCGSVNLGQPSLRGEEERRKRERRRKEKGEGEGREERRERCGRG